MLVSARTGEGVDELAARPRRPAARVATGSSSSSSRGRVATCWPPSTARARWWVRATGRSRPRCRWCWTTWAGPASPSSWRRRDVPPPALPLRPPHRPGQAGRGARGRHGRLLHRDTVRPAPAGRLEALASSGTERGYPASAGSPPAAGGGRSLAGPSLRAGGRAGVVGGRVRRDQGAGGLGAARAPAARAGEGHGALPGGVVPDLRHGGGAGRVPRRPGAAPERTAWRARPRRHRPPPTPSAPSCCGRTRRRTRPGGWEIWAQRRRGDGPIRSPFSPTSATPSSRGTGRRARSSNTAPTAWSPCTRSRSVRTWPACASASTPGTPSWSNSCGPCASTPA